MRSARIEDAIDKESVVALPIPGIDEDGIPWCRSSCPLYAQFGDERLYRRQYDNHLIRAVNAYYERGDGGSVDDADFVPCLPAIREMAATIKNQDRRTR